MSHSPALSNVSPNHWSRAPISEELCYIYVIRCGDAFKIGITGNLGKRLRTLQLANPYPIEIVSYRSVRPSLIREIERQIIAELLPHRIWGEWFRVPQRTMERTRDRLIARHHASRPPVPWVVPPEVGTAGEVAAMNARIAADWEGSA